MTLSICYNLAHVHCDLDALSLCVYNSTFMWPVIFMLLIIDPHHLTALALIWCIGTTHALLAAQFIITVIHELIINSNSVCSYFTIFTNNELIINNAWCNYTIKVNNTVNVCLLISVVFVLKLRLLHGWLARSEGARTPYMWLIINDYQMLLLRNNKGFTGGISLESQQ